MGADNPPREHAHTCPCAPAAVSQVMRGLGVHTTSAAAAQLLRDIGVWGPHELQGLRQAGLTAFPPELEVCVTESPHQRPIA